MAAAATLGALETPCLILDRVIMERNVQALHTRLRAADVPLRPHVKTSKCIEIARLLCRGQPGGITVSTLTEAEYFASRGFRDILYGVAVAPNKLAHAAALVRSGVELKLLLDNALTARAASEVATQEGVEFPVLIEVDVDGHRSGVAIGTPELHALAATIRELPGLALRGILSHAGSAYDCTTIDAIKDVAEQERRVMTLAAGLLTRVGVERPEVSVGSTPTARAAVTFMGITEVRAGVFVFNDLMQAQLGGCAMADIALSVLSTVIGYHSAKHRIVIDAGWSSLSLESQVVGQVRIFGRIADLNGRCCDDLVLTVLNQEHGIVTRLSGKPIAERELPVGSNVRIVPVHACSTAAAHDRYHVVEGSHAIVDVWRRLCGSSPPA